MKGGILGVCFWGRFGGFGRFFLCLCVAFLLLRAVFLFACCVLAVFLVPLYSSEYLITRAWTHEIVLCPFRFRCTYNRTCPHFST